MPIQKNSLFKTLWLMKVLRIYRRGRFDLMIKIGWGFRYLYYLKNRPNTDMPFPLNH